MLAMLPVEHARLVVFSVNALAVNTFNTFFFHLEFFFNVTVLCQSCVCFIIFRKSVHLSIYILRQSVHAEAHHDHKQFRS